MSNDATRNDENDMTRSMESLKGTTRTKTLASAGSTGAVVVLIASIVGAALGGAMGCWGDPEALAPVSDAVTKSDDAGAPLESDAAAASATPAAAADSPARRYFREVAYAALSRCAACHASGTDGATLFFSSDEDSSYKTLDANGLIMGSSPLLTKGPHASGAGPALDLTKEEPAVRRWLELEDGERAGQAAPTNILSKVAQCMNKDLFAKIDLCSTMTQPRAGENGNQCTGCKFEACANCHAQGGQNTGFWCSQQTVNNQTTTNVDDTLINSRALPYIRRYIGLSGTDPVPSHAILNKSKSTRTASTVSAHPWFEIDAAKQVALDKFVQDAIDHYKAGDCSTDGG